MIELPSTAYLLGRPTLMRLELGTIVKKLLRTASCFTPTASSSSGPPHHHDSLRACLK